MTNKYQWNVERMTIIKEGDTEERTYEPDGDFKENILANLDIIKKNEGFFTEEELEKAYEGNDGCYWSILRYRAYREIKKLKEDILKLETFHNDICDLRGSNLYPIKSGG